MKKFILAILCLLSFGTLYACETTTVTAKNIYVTVYPLEYIVKVLSMGTDITVGMVPGVTSHEESVDWSPKQIIAMTEAKYLFYVGANFDVYIDNQIEAIFRNKDVELYKLETAIPDLLIEGVIDEHDGEEHTLSEPTLGLDPHFWISPKRMLMVVDFFYGKLIDPVHGYPEYAETIEANRLGLIAQLTTLDASFDDVINLDSKKIMTSTNLYGYLAADYGLNYCSISPGYHEEADQFTTAQKDLIITEATENNIRYIIYELNSSSPLSNAIFDALVALGVDPVKLEFDILHTLKEEEQALGHNYYNEMIDINLEAIKTATGYPGQE
jgi:ABC-type Zn uptake system ZnuABC Zn-binding protein ZnuA